MKNNMAAKIINFCFAARQIGLKRISNSQSLVQCAKCLNTRLLFSPLYSSTSNFSSTVNGYTEQSLTKNTNNELQKPEELDVLYKNILLEYKCHDTGVIRSYQKFTEMAAKELDIEISGMYTPKRDITRFAVLKSVHVYKKHKVQYETRTHYKVIELKHITESTADTFLEYLQRNLPEGVAMKITKTRLERIPEHILQDQLKRESEIRKDHMVLEDVSGTYTESHENEDFTQSSLDSAQSESEKNETDFKSENTLETASESAIKTASESVLDAKNEETVKDGSDSDSSSSSDSDSDSDSDSESKDKAKETDDSPNDKSS